MTRSALEVIGREGSVLHIEIQKVSMTYQSPDGEVEALRDVSFTIPESALLSIVGPSGCGKSTLLSLMAGLETPTSGQIVLDGVPISGPAKSVGLMPQKDQLFEWRTILNNVLLGPEIRKEKTDDVKNSVRAMLDQYMLLGFSQKQPSQLSGGMRQRCALIRTLALAPEVLLLDEPFSALDYQTRLAVSDDIAQIIRRTGKTAVLVTHDISEAISMSDQIVVLSQRPGCVKAIHNLHSMDGMAPMARRSLPEFQAVFKTIWEELDVNA